MKQFMIISEILCGIFLFVANVGATPPPEFIDLTQAAIVVSDDSNVVRTAQRMLTEEVEKRTGINLKHAAARGDGAAPAIILCRTDTVPARLRDFVQELNVPEKAEGFAIGVYSENKAPTVVLAGRDEGGVLFAAGRLLLQLKMTKGQLELPADYRIATAPRYPHRGHQIGYRDLSHCYDAWTPDTYEQYMRELAVFGANAFETFFGNSEGRVGSHAKVTEGEMTKAWSRICADYDFDYWIFDEAVGGRGKSAADIEKAVEHKLDRLRAMPKIDHIYLTGGDGGTSHRRPDLMFEWTGRFAEEARKIHPDLGVWISNQGFGPELNNWFFDYLQREQPDWVTGVVYGAWSRILLDEQRARVPKQYPIRRYSDIGHCVRAQYTVPGWDRALAQTLGREPFAPRPRGHARIHNLFDEYADGFVTYSDGVGDDVNKFVWTALGWDPDRPLDDVMLDYARFFFGWDIAEKVREGLYRFEDHFTGSLAANEGVAETFALWKALEDEADDGLLANWRFQECLLRAYYDHYTRLRLLKANDIEARACAVLREAPAVGVEKAIANARVLLKEPDQDDYTDTLRARIVELGAELFDSIGAQLDTANYQATTPERGAVLDFLDTPLNNRLWLENELDAILSGRFTASMPEKTGDGDVRLARLARVYDWENPGPGGFYDDLGCAWKQPHLVKPKPLWDDPAGITTPREGHSFEKGAPNRLSWTDTEDAHSAAPLAMRYEGLDPEASYRVRVTYLGRYKATIRLVADGEYEIHSAYGHTLEGVRYKVTYGDSAAVVTPEEDGPSPVVTPLEFVIPREATADGVLELDWQRFTGRGIQVAEVWLIEGGRGD
jgi:hypothetical protein